MQFVYKYLIPSPASAPPIARITYTEEQHTTTFFELAAERFTVRAGRRPTPADEAIVLKDMQVLEAFGRRVCAIHTSES